MLLIIHPLSTPIKSESTLKLLPCLLWVVTVEYQIMLEREVYTEIPGCKLIPIQKEVVTRSLERISADPFGSGEQDTQALLNSNPQILSLIGSAIAFEPFGMVLNLYHEGIVRTYRLFINQAINNGITIPRISEIKSHGLAQTIHNTNLAISRASDLTELEDLYKHVGKILSVNHRHFVDGIQEITRYSYYGESFGLGAFDTFRFMYDFLSGKPVKIWTNLN